MEWTIGAGVVDGEREIAEADFPKIRFFTVPNVVSATARARARRGRVADRLAGDAFPRCRRWPTSSPGTSTARRTCRSGSWTPPGAGTPAEAWTSPEQVLSLPEYRDRMTEILASDKDWETVFEENEARAVAKQRADRGPRRRPRPTAPTCPDTTTRPGGPCPLPNDEPISDFVWLRRTVTLAKAAKTGYRLRLGAFGGVDAVFVNGDAGLSAGRKRAGARGGPSPRGREDGATTSSSIRALNGWNNQVQVGHPGPMTLSPEGGSPVVDLSGAWRFSNTVEPPMPEYVRYSHTPSFLVQRDDRAHRRLHPHRGHLVPGREQRRAGPRLPDALPRDDRRLARPVARRGASRSSSSSWPTGGPASPSPRPATGPSSGRPSS